MALPGQASFNRAGYFVLYGSVAVLFVALVVAYFAPAWQDRLTGYPSHPLGWYGWALLPFGIAAQLLLLRTFGGGGLWRWLFASVITAVWLGSLLLLHMCVWRLIDDHRDFGSGATIKEQDMAVDWAIRNRGQSRRSTDHYYAHVPMLKQELALHRQDFDRLREGRPDVLNKRLAISGRWCFRLRAEYGRRGAVRILGREDGRLPPGSVVPCQPGEVRG
jgi:hypothetical protein